MLKFGLSEKHTKFEKNLPRGFEKSANLRKRQKHEDFFFKLCVLLKKSELYLKITKPCRKQMEENYPIW